MCSLRRDYFYRIDLLRWRFPNEIFVEESSYDSLPAIGDQLFATSFSGWVGTATFLYRGDTYNSPDGEHCCVTLFLDFNASLVRLSE